MGRNKWTRAEDKLFEEALVIFSDHKLDNFKWKKIAGYVPGRSLEELKAHYDDLLHDIDQIDSGRVELPCYSDGFSRISFAGSKISKGDVDRKRGTPWTEEEHRLFLIGLEKYGKGDWRSISRNVVVTRTPTQVASHAQKYFLRQNSGRKERKRNSIHDITTVDRKSGSPPGTTLQQTNASPHYGATKEGGSFGYQNFGFPL